MKGHFSLPMRQGYIALISVLIISALLTSLSLLASTSVFFARDSARHTYSHVQSVELARSCAAIAPRILEYHLPIVPTEPIQLQIHQDQICTLFLHERSLLDMQIVVHANVDRTNVLLRVNANRTTANEPYSVSDIDHVSNIE